MNGDCHKKCGIFQQKSSILVHFLVRKGREGVIVSLSMADPGIKQHCDVEQLDAKTQFYSIRLSFVVQSQFTFFLQIITLWNEFKMEK